MKPSEKNGILKVYVGESDKVDGRVLFEELILQARNDGMAGATAYRGIMSFGASHSIHTMKIFALSNDLPVTIEIIDTIEKLDSFTAKANQLLDKSEKGGLITFQELSVVRYKKGNKYT